MVKRNGLNLFCMLGRLQSKYSLRRRSIVSIEFNPINLQIFNSTKNIDHVCYHLIPSRLRSVSVYH